jgi:hypothetical protein
MDTAATGNAGEAAVLDALVQRGFRLLLPFGSGHPYDLVLALDDSIFLRIQCKVAWPRGGCLIFNCRSTDHGHGPRPYVGLADIFGVFFPLNERVYLVPVGAVAPSEGRLRVEPARNNQKRRIRDAAEFEVYKWSRTRLRLLARTGQDQAIEPLRDAITMNATDT